MTSPNTPVDVEESKDMGSSSAERAALLAPQANCPEAPSVAGKRDFWPFNINGYVRIRLTPEGRALLMQNHYDLFGGIERCIIPYRPPAEDADGWVKMQAWEVMQAFGARVGAGRAVPFETEIQIEAPPLGAAGEAEAALSATDELTLSRLLAERREMLEALKELVDASERVARGMNIDPRAEAARFPTSPMGKAYAILSASPEGKGE